MFLNYKELMDHITENHRMSKSKSTVLFGHGAACLWLSYLGGKGKKIMNLRQPQLHSLRLAWTT